MDRAFPPEPEESGFLEPPRRRPPTAVATATPPPPYKPGNYRHFRSKARLVAYSILATAFGACALASFATMSPWGYLIGALTLVTSIGVSIRVRSDLIDRRQLRARRQHRSAA